MPWNNWFVYRFQRCFTRITLIDCEVKLLINNSWFYDECAFNNPVVKLIRYPCSGLKSNLNPQKIQLYCAKNTDLPSSCFSQILARTFTISTLNKLFSDHKITATTVQIHLWLNEAEYTLCVHNIIIMYTGVKNHLALKWANEETFVLTKTTPITAPRNSVK